MLLLLTETPCCGVSAHMGWDGGGIQRSYRVFQDRLQWSLFGPTGRHTCWRFVKRHHVQTPRDASHPRLMRPLLNTPQLTHTHTHACTDAQRTRTHTAHAKRDCKSTDAAHSKPQGHVCTHEDATACICIMWRVMHGTLTHTNVITVFTVKVHQMIRQKTRAATNPDHVHSPSDQSGLFKPPYSPHHTLLCTALPCCCLLPTPAFWSFAILPAPHFYKNIHTYREWINWDRALMPNLALRYLC